MIYIDVDGVLANFEAGIRHLGFEGDLQNRVPGELEKFMAKNYDGVFRDAPPTRYLPFFKRMMTLENIGAQNCRILTAIGSCYKAEHIDTVMENKYWWLEEHGFLRERVDIVATAADKLKYCRSGDVLYDDKQWTIDRWNELGGIGFLVDNKNLTIT